MKNILLSFINFYKKVISPFLRPRCRYHPSCSLYVEEALHEWGAIKGSWIGFKRICRCQPWGGYGFDFVPKKRTKKEKDSCKNIELNIC